MTDKAEPFMEMGRVYQSVYSIIEQVDLQWGMPSWSLHFEIYGTALLHHNMQNFQSIRSWTGDLGVERWYTFRKTSSASETCLNKNTVKHTCKWGTCPQSKITIPIVLNNRQANVFKINNLERNTNTQNKQHNDNSGNCVLRQTNTNNENMKVLGNKIYMKICTCMLFFLDRRQVRFTVVWGENRVTELDGLIYCKRYYIMQLLEYIHYNYSHIQARLAYLYRIQLVQ